MEQPYRANTLIVKSVGMLPGVSAEYTSLTMNVQHIKIQAAIFDTALFAHNFKQFLIGNIVKR